MKWTTAVILLLVRLGIAQAAPCAKVGDTITVRGVFVAESNPWGPRFLPHAFPYRAFCVDFTPPAESEKLRRLAQLPLLGGTPESWMSPSEIPRDKLTMNKYVEVTGTISVPHLGPGEVVQMPSITISKIVDVDGEVRATVGVWLADCQKWQEDNLSEFSKKVPGATIERLPPVPILQQRIYDSDGRVWAQLVAQRCALSATPASKVIVPAPQPVVLVRPEQ
jgi:hypothetical protein